VPAVRDRDHADARRLQFVRAREGTVRLRVEEGARHRQVQQQLPLKAKNAWGGKREGAGRKPLPRALRKGIRHERRPDLQRRHPLHVTVRMADHVWNLRARRTFKLLAEGLHHMRDSGARLTHYSVQGNHLHLILEVESRLMLSRAMRSFAIRAAKALNALMGRRGRVVADRYHVEVLDNPTRVRRAINYVLSNVRKHAADRNEQLPPLTRDAYAAGPAEHVPPTMALRPSPLVVEPRTWLLRVGWSRGRVAALP